MKTYLSKDFNFGDIKRLISADELNDDLRNEYYDEIILIDNKPNISGNVCGWDSPEKYVSDKELIKIKEFLIKANNNTPKSFLKNSYEKYINIIEEILKIKD